MADPANIAKAKQKALEFGCERISVGVQNGNLTGEMRCAEKVGTRIALTGTLKFSTVTVLVPYFPEDSGLSRSACC
jgi:hypothetical protein